MSSSSEQRPLNEQERAALMIRRTAAFFASLLIGPGAGQLAMGRRWRAALWFVAGALTVLPGPLISIWAFWANLPLRLLAGVDAAALRRPNAGLPRWVEVLGLWAALFAAIFGLKIGASSVYSIVASADGAMAPTVQVHEQVLAYRRDRSAPRGALVVVVDPKDDRRMRVGRVVAVAGEKVAVRDGELLINGRGVEASPQAGACRFADAKAPVDPKTQSPMAPKKRQRRPERLEGDCRAFLEKAGSVSYTVLRAKEAGESLDLAERVVPAGHVFVLGDNRGLKTAVVGAVAQDKVLARLRTIFWSSAPGGLRWDRIGLQLR